MDVINTIYKLRDDFILIGLTGRTGSGCSTVARILSTPTDKLDSLKSLYSAWNSQKINNDARKNRIIYNFISKHWSPFKIIKASDIIFFYVLLENYAVFNEVFACVDFKNGTIQDESDVQRIFKANKIEETYENLSQKAKKYNEILKTQNFTTEDVEEIIQFINIEIPKFRNQIDSLLKGSAKETLTDELQKWGNNIRSYDSIKEKSIIDENSPSCLAIKINQIIKAYCFLNKKCGKEGTRESTHIVVDALRNPYEVLYYRERYSTFYLMSVNTSEAIRKQALFMNGYKKTDIDKLDKEEREKKDFKRSFQEIDLDKCIELSDIHITRDSTPANKNRDLVNQIFTYISLILHPGLVSPSPIERLMQIAYTAKLNSGCLSRQVGAAITDANFSIKSIGWNTTAEGQTPCTLRNMDDLLKGEDDNAFSVYERNDEKFHEKMKSLCLYYSSDNKNNNAPRSKLIGLPLTYCFKDVYTSIENKQTGNQVHTRSLHAEENAFLQLAKYGSVGIKGGKLFTTASPCELCAKKAYQLGIKEIYYIDSYPGISQKHILECGSNPPKMILFKGAIGRAYINLYNPFLPMKDEIEALTSVKVKEFLSGKINNMEKQEAKSYNASENSLEEKNTKTVSEHQSKNIKGGADGCKN